ncbi:MAG TPA: tRNA (adenosine(37)-N6)-threonylcarbamoyltransferase complex dimerization subunit type 1 TsaB [Alphaproteobacteria bacterium]|nr:tRNA (adenosine(37)-N6)-threonylcarbamoyltransferase complex dimerization subunit type 1 TsaB [Alphaproteobacteria bacterium]
MRILALDSSGAACSAALWAEGAVRAQRWEPRARGHAERLLPMVLEVASEAGTALASIDLFAATTGPGGFTGVRIGLAALRGLALAAARPMLGVTSFAALAHATAAEERAGRSLLAVIDSKRDELFVQAFDENLAAESEGMVLAADAIAERHGARPLLLAGDGAARVIAALRARGCDVREAASAAFIDAAVVARIAAARAPEACAEPPAPFYLRPPSVKIPAAGVR